MARTFSITRFGEPYEFTSQLSDEDTNAFRLYQEFIEMQNIIREATRMGSQDCNGQ
jgi:cell fate (sporulation/competence/biofilm development) regulator YlbF (YheA/YmcA/DUF963 family)